MFLFFWMAFWRKKFLKNLLDFSMSCCSSTLKRFENPSRIQFLFLLTTGKVLGWTSSKWVEKNQLPIVEHVPDICSAWKNHHMCLGKSHRLSAPVSLSLRDHPKFMFILQHHESRTTSQKESNNLFCIALRSPTQPTPRPQQGNL